MGYSLGYDEQSIAAIASSTVMQERRADLCELTNEELDYVLGGDGLGGSHQRRLVVKAEQLHSAQVKFEE